MMHDMEASIYSSSSLFCCRAVLLLAVSSRAVVGISRECLTSLETPNQKRFICISNPDFFPVLKYAEMIAGDECRRAFNNEAWNCSSFSLMKIPSIARDGKLKLVYKLAMAVFKVLHVYTWPLECHCYTHTHTYTHTERDKGL